MNIVVKNGNAQITKGKGFSFDNWVKYKLIEDFRLIPNGPCCNNKQLKFKNGLTNTGNRINAINGTITFDTKIEKGLKIDIAFPIL